MSTVLMRLATCFVILEAVLHVASKYQYCVIVVKKSSEYLVKMLHGQSSVADNAVASYSIVSSTSVKSRVMRVHANHAASKSH